MKNILMLAIAFVLFAYSFSLFAQSSPAPVAAVASSPAAPVIAAPASPGLSDFLVAHGGIMAVVIAVMLGLNAVLSGARDFVAFLDGVPKGQPIPAQYVGLSKLNIICVWLGKILDYLQGNVAH